MFPKGDLRYTIHRDRQIERFRELILYVCEAFKKAEYFGATKLNKALFYSDFRTYARLGVPVTGMKYFRLPNGPAPHAMLPVRRDMMDEGSLVEVLREMPDGTTQRRSTATRPPNLILFSPAELEIVDDVIGELWSQTAKEVSDASHSVGWKVLQHKDFIPYDFTMLDDEPISEKLVARTRELAAKHGWQ